MHCALQLPTQDTQLPEHPPEQWDAHPLQPDAISEAFDSKGTFANAMAPRIGRAPLAAFLKN